MTTPPPVVGDSPLLPGDREDARAAAARLRRRLLAWSAPVVAVVALVALYFALLPAIAGTGVWMASVDADAGARDAFEITDRIGVVEDWKPVYNLGTLEYRDGDPYGASVLLEEALRRVPTEEDGRSQDECKVAINLSLAYEALGDEAAGFGDAAGAVEYYDLAIATTQGCESESSSEGESEDEQDQRQDADESQQRQQDKRDELTEGSEGDGSGGEGDQSQDGADGGDGSGGDAGEGSGEDQGDGSDQPDGDGSADGGDQGERTDESDGSAGDEGSGDPLDELQDLNDQAQENAQEERQSGSGGDGSGQGW